MPSPRDLSAPTGFVYGQFIVLRVMWKIASLLCLPPAAWTRFSFHSGLYHEIASFMAQAGYGGPTLYFLLQYLGVVIENIRSVRRHFQAHPWQGRVWTLTVVVVPLGVLVPPGLVDEVLVPMLVEAGVPGLE